VDGTTWEGLIEGELLPTRLPNFENIKTIILGKTVTSLSNEIFREHKNLEELYIPDTLTRIGSFAFFNCAHLKSLHIPNSVNPFFVDYVLFYGCSSLTSISLPDSTSSIET
jgi:hypothetical protein